MKTRSELIRIIRERYQRSDRYEKTKIIDEFVNISGYHRKHAIRLINSHEKRSKHQTNSRKLYDEAVKQALIVIWEVADRICGKRLKAIMPILIESLAHHGHLTLEDNLRSKLLKISPATIDRLLAPIREPSQNRKRRRRSSSCLKKKIPIRTYTGWKDPLPGYFEGDLVAHCGGVVKGSYIHTLVLTDIATGWTEFFPLTAREQSLVLATLDIIRSQLPIEMLGLDTDNDSVFITESLIDYCHENQIEFTRCRPYRKNDQAWIEQKNGAIIRKNIGYDRYEGIYAFQILSKLYDSLRLYVNYFQPSFKLLAKERDGSKIVKKYLPPLTPCDRILNHPAVNAKTKILIRQKRAKLDPLKLLRYVRKYQEELLELEEMQNNKKEFDRSNNLKEFIGSLSYLWRQGDPSPIGRKKKRKLCLHDWRTRPDPFGDVVSELRSWFEEEPDITAKELFNRLQIKYPVKFADGQLRTLQRRVKHWRKRMAKQLIGSCFGQETD